MYVSEVAYKYAELWPQKVNYIFAHPTTTTITKAPVNSLQG